MPDHFYYILFGLTSVFIFLSWLKSGSFFNPVTIFNLWWGFFLFVSSLELAGLRLPSMRAYYLLFLAVTMFSLGGITFISGKKYPLKPVPDINKFIKPYKLTVFLYFQILMTIFLLIYSQKAVSMLASMDPGQYRAIALDESGIMGDNRKYFFYIVLPSLYINAFVSICGVLYGRIKKRYLLLALFNLLLYSIVTIGRVPVFIAMMGFSFGVIYLAQIRKIKIRLIYVLIALIPVIFMVSMSVFRKSHASGSKGILDIFLSYFVWYFTGPFTAFDYFLDFCKEGIGYQYSYARAIFAGLEDFFDPITRRVFSGYQPINESIHGFVSNFRSLGGTATHHNSHYTMLTEFMWDAGIYGIIIYSYLFGAILSKVYNSFRTKHSISNFAILLLLTYLSLMGIMRWELRYIWSWATLAGIFLFSQKFIVKKIALDPANE